jgi:hypothetical protein
VAAVTEEVGEMLRTTRWTRALALLLVLLVAVAAGCGSMDESSDSSDDSEGASDDAGDGDEPFTVGPGDELVGEGAEGAPPTSTGDEGSDDEPVPPADTSLTAGRRFVSTANLTVSSDDVATTSQRAIALVESKGGALFAESSTYQGEPQAVLTLKVPPDEFSATLRGLGDLGTVIEQGVETEDVTERVVDLESRIDTASRSVSRLQGFLGGATTVADVAAFETELSTRESELETLRAQLRTLEDRVDLATIVFTVRAPVEDDAVADDPDEADAIPSFLDGLEGGWSAFVTAGSVLLAIVGALLPFVPLVLVPWALYRLFHRRRPAAAEAGAAG